MKNVHRVTKLSIQKLSIPNQSLPILLDHVSRFLPDHKNPGVHVSPGHGGHHRGVNHPQPSHAVHPQPRIDDGVGIALGSHFARADLVVHHRGQVLDGTPPVIVRGELEARAARELDVVQLAVVPLERLGSRYVNSEFQSFQDQFQVVRMRVEIRVHPRRRERVLGP